MIPKKLSNKLNLPGNCLFSFSMPLHQFYYHFLQIKYGNIHYYHYVIASNITVILSCPFMLGRTVGGGLGNGTEGNKKLEVREK